MSEKVTKKQYILNIYTESKQKLDVENVSKQNIFSIKQLLSNLKNIKEKKWKNSQHFINFVAFFEKQNSISSKIYHFLTSIYMIVSILASFYTDDRYIFDFVVLAILIFEVGVRIFIGITYNELIYKIKYIFSFAMIIDYYIILSIIALYCLEQNSMKEHIAYKIFLSTQPIKIFHLDRYLHFINSLTNTWLNYKKELLTGYCLCLFLIYTMGFVFFFIESPSYPDIDRPNALYWSAIAFLTIGFGDISPKTVPGRIVMTIVGIALLSLGLLPSILLGSGMALNIKSEVKKKIGTRLNNSAARLIQRYWYFRQSTKKNYTEISKDQLKHIYNAEILKNEKLLNSSASKKKLISQTENIIEDSENIISNENSDNDTLIICTDFLGNYKYDYAKKIWHTSVAVTFAKYVYMLVSLKDFKRTNGSVNKDDELKFLVTAVKSLGSRVKKITNKKDRRLKEIEKLQLVFNGLNYRLDAISSLYNDTKNIRIKLENALKDKK